MGSEALTGSRIRERRQVLGLRQADLARKIGISGSYLNLIEHNRRRIGGKLLLQIADELGVDSTSLSEGAERALLGTLREADADAAQAGAELDRIEEFAGRFPGWAQVLSLTYARVGQLEQTVEGLNDRLTHDPALAASVHEVLSTAASIHSTATILADNDGLEREWLNRFVANINQDSARLAESSRDLAGFLEQDTTTALTQHLPQEEVDDVLTRNGHFFPELEPDAGGAETAVSTIAARAQISDAGRAILETVLLEYAADAKRLPMSELKAALDAEPGVDPVALARFLDAPISVVLRRMASVPGLDAGYVLCDRSGSLLLRKGLPGFALPRFGASCPLWPLFQALSQPGTVVHQEVEQLGRRQVKFDCYAFAELMGPAPYNMAPLVRSGMLILPSSSPGEAELKVGATCRICPRVRCPGRREPSVLTPVA